MAELGVPASDLFGWVEIKNGLGADSGRGHTHARPM